MSENAFLKDPEYYTRDINPIVQYVEQMSFFTSVMTGRDIEECRKRIIAGVKAKKINASDPEVVFYERGDNGDRYKESTRLSSYIKDVKTNERVLAPTMTCYMNTQQCPSKLTKFVDGNVVKRSIAKKASFKAKAEKKMDLFVIKDNEQANAKRFNNAMSGAFGAEGSVLKNPTAHNTLTSITRTVSSIGNSSNEKIIMGNRHYFNFEVTLNNLIYIASSCDEENMCKVLDKYNLVYPTAEQAMLCVKRSTELYWCDRRKDEKLFSFLAKLKPVHRAAIVYGGDLWHIRKFNPEFMDVFLTGMSKQGYYDGEDPIGVIHKTDEMFVNYVHQICMDQVRGIGKDYKKISEKDQRIVAGTCISLTEFVNDHKDFFDVLFLTRNIPASTAHIPNMVRRAVVLSDTDSTMFSVDDWAIWKFGELRFDQAAYAFGGAVMFIATQCIAHNLAIFSANMNVERAKLFKLAMKPEFVFPVFAQTSVAKHYYTCTLVKEGNVYEDIEMEIKGVHLKNSASPPAINKQAHAAMEDILRTIMKGGKIKLSDHLTRIGDLERSISNSLLSSESTYLKSSKIKQPDSYSKGRDEAGKPTPHLTPYLHHMLWEEVWADKYGQIAPPPYSTVKIPTILENKTKTLNWINSLPDKEIAGKLKAWMVKYGKTSLPTMYFSKDYISAYGIPDEVKTAINLRKIILDMTKTDRIVLESLGYFPKKNTMISETGF